MTSLRVEADGGSRGNPGPAAYGALVRDPSSGAVLAEAAESVGVATNNVAEYRGLIAGLQLAVELDADELEVRMDSKLVIEQMAGRWKVKHPDMKPLALQARRLAPTSTTWTWVPRADNAAADALLNAVLDGGPPVWRIPERPSSGDTGEMPVASAHPDLGEDGSSSGSEPDGPTVLVLRVGHEGNDGTDGTGTAPALPPIAGPDDAQATRDRVWREYSGRTARMVADARAAALLVSYLLTGDDQLSARLESAAGTEIELAWYSDGSVVLRRLGG